MNRPFPPFPPRHPPGVGATLGWSPAELVLLVGLAGLAVAGGFVWTAAQLAALGAHGRPVPLAAGQLPGVLARLADHPADPAAAFPPPAARTLPGPAGCYAAAAVVLLAGCALALGGARLAGRRRRARAPAAAAWAGARQLRPLTLTVPAPARLVLGRHRRRLVAAERCQAVIVLGPARSGKTTGLVIPGIIEWDGPVIATSVRRDLVDVTAPARAGRGEVWVYDPTAAPPPPAGPGHAGGRAGGAGAGWDPLAGCAEWTHAQRVAVWLCDAGRHGTGMGDEDFWYAVAAKLLAPLLFAAARGRHTIADVVRWVDTQEQTEPAAELHAAGEPAATHAALASWGREPRTLSSAYTTAEVVLRALADPAVLASTRTPRRVTAERLLDGQAHTLYVCAPSHEQARLRPLFSALLHELITAAYTRAAAGQPLARPLLIMLDEAANIAPLRDLDTLASTAAGTGIQLVTVWQDLAQITTRYGQRAGTVVNNHRAKLLLSGVSDQPTLAQLSGLLGDAAHPSQSVSTDATGRHSTTDATIYRSLAPADTLRRLPPGEALLVYGHLPPARLRLRAWYADPALRRHATSTGGPR